jgi:hypothetical protein
MVELFTIFNKAEISALKGNKMRSYALIKGVWLTRFIERTFFDISTLCFVLKAPPPPPKLECHHLYLSLSLSSLYGACL